MRHARALLPYAVASLIVVAASTLALAYAVVDLRDLREARESRAAEPTASAAPRALPELSATTRLAYWRTDAATGGAELLVSNVDGSLRRAVAEIDSARRATLTRWTPRGDAVTYVEGGAELVRVEVDGTTTVMRIAPDARQAGYTRIVDQRWSPDGTRVIVTAVRPDLRSDVFTARVGERELVAITTLEDVFATYWIDDAHVLVCTGGGVVGVLSVDGTNAIRPLVGIAATSPILADDGRVHFLSGAVSPSPRDTTLPYLTASGATVWSATVDGTELRQETRTALDDVRLDARYAPGRYLAHRGSSSAQVILGESVMIPPIEAGAVERAVVSPDGRSAIGFTASRMIRYEIGRTTPAAFGRPAVMLDLVSGGDVWYRSEPVTLARSTRTPARTPVQYALPLGGHLWLMAGDGKASLLRPRSPQTGRRTVPLPQWSPDGQRLLTLELAGDALPGVGRSTPVAVTIDRSGEATRYEAARAATGVPTWSPDGSAFVVVVDRRGVEPFSSAAELEARFLTLDGRTARAPIAARDAVWTRAGILTLSERGVELHDGASRRTVADLARILADPRGGFPAERQSVTVASLAASPDGAFASFRVSVSPASGASRFAIAVVRVSDGAVLAYLPGASVSDVAWAPSGARLGLTAAGTRETTAQVRDVTSDRVIASWPGRFAGWAPDAGSVYVARSTGLYAYPVAGGDAQYVGPVGVPVSTTALR